MQEFMELVRNRPDFWMSMVGILMMLIGSGYFVYFVMKKMKEDARAAGGADRPQRRS